MLHLVIRFRTNQSVGAVCNIRNANLGRWNFDAMYLRSRHTSTTYCPLMHTLLLYILLYQRRVHYSAYVGVYKYVRITVDLVLAYCWIELVSL